MRSLRLGSGQFRGSDDTAEGKDQVQAEVCLASRSLPFPAVRCSSLPGPHDHRLVTPPLGSDTGRFPTLTL